MDILEELGRSGAVLVDKHFVYKSGKHGSGYIDPDRILPSMGSMQRYCRSLATPFMKDNVDVVVAPAVGGIVLAVLTASWLGNWFVREVGAVWADKDGDTYSFERAGFDEQVTKRRVLVVDDLLTAGTSIKGTIAAIAPYHPQIVGAAVLVNRGGVTAEDLGVPRLESLASVDFEAVDSGQCQLCKQRVPIVTDFGHGDKLQSIFPEYEGGFVKLKR